jgi:uncharacterized protein (DUF1810 family)
LSHGDAPHRERTTVDPFALERFVEAQDSGDTYVHAVAELSRAEKQSHWMWFVFPQLAGLGRSPMAKQFAIASLQEAQAYLRHPVLGPRLATCTGIVASTEGRSAEQIFGAIDAQKLRSSMTLFLRATPSDALFSEILERYFDGEADPETDALLVGRTETVRSGEPR